MRIFSRSLFPYFFCPHFVLLWNIFMGASEILPLDPDPYSVDLWRCDVLQDERGNQGAEVLAGKLLQELRWDECLWARIGHREGCTCQVGFDFLISTFSQFPFVCKVCSSFPQPCCFLVPVHTLGFFFILSSVCYRGIGKAGAVSHIKVIWSPLAVKKSTEPLQRNLHLTTIPWKSSQPADCKYCLIGHCAVFLFTRYHPFKQ